MPQVIEAINRPDHTGELRWNEWIADVPIESPVPRRCDFRRACALGMCDRSSGHYLARISLRDREALTLEPPSYRLNLGLRAPEASVELGGCEPLMVARRSGILEFGEQLV